MNQNSDKLEIISNYLNLVNSFYNNVYKLINQNGLAGKKYMKQILLYKDYALDLIKHQKELNF